MPVNCTPKPRIPQTRRRPTARPAFTLIELLVTIAVVAVLVSVLLPALSGARRAADAAACLSNLRQIALVTLAYADENQGTGPALGAPYASLPNWALVVQRESRPNATAPADFYRTDSVLVCEAARRLYRPDMTRTYAMNATGLAGLPGDRADYDTDTGASVQIWRLRQPARTVLAIDSAPGSVATGAPPPTRTASVIDFRQPAHVPARIGAHHDPGNRFNTVNFDASASAEALRPADDPPLHPRFTAILP